MRKLAQLAVVAVLLSPLHPVLAQGTPASPPAIDFSGWIFGNFQVRTDSAAKASLGGKNPNQFTIERAYLTFRMPAGEHASIRVTTDIFQNANNAYYNGWSVRLKYAYLQYNFTNSLFGVDGMPTLGRIGVLHTVIVDYVEQFFPRWIARAPTEQNAFFSSADLGIASLTTLPGRHGEVYATITNGPGYTSPEIDRFKDVAARVSWTPFGKDTGLARTISFTPWYYKGWVASAAPALYTDGLKHDRYGFFAGIRDRRLTGGLEWAQRINGVEVLGPPRVVANQTARLVDGFVLARPFELANPSKHSPFVLVARYDRLKPNTSADPYNGFTILGAIWDVTNRASLALDYQSQTYTNYAAAAGAPVPTTSWFLHWSTTF